MHCLLLFKFMTIGRLYFMHDHNNPTLKLINI